MIPYALTGYQVFHLCCSKFLRRREFLAEYIKVVETWQAVKPGYFHNYSEPSDVFYVPEHLGC